ncbi:7-cyano-7-deazaguanine synthase [Coxiella endosymbiont of Ornithodoros amblus]|uniref:7-cyano-7-deazaguanine synthase n=1 Tax=Coxiella endosymbiont of Ornithodoros amblus TaxID=1656166 RepID=UPI00244E388E|nr:7-cyano-7-deazaguanine synthase [Coxiella endosymbiont of Ornithodoros amblus]
MKQVVILISGGLDSTTYMTVVKSKGFACYALSFDYGQKHLSELVAAEKIAAHFNVVQYEIVSFQLESWAALP